MGNRVSGPLREAYNPTLKGWHITKSTERFNVWQNISTGEEMEEYRFVLNDAKDMNREKQIFEFRYDSNILVSSRFFREDTQRELCSTYYKGTLFLQRIPIRLSNINDLPFPDVLHVYHQAFRGFAQLHDKMGFFHIEEEMICVNQQGRIKVWANGQLEKNYSADGIIGAVGSERDMVRKIVQLIHQNTDVNTLPDNLGELLQRADPPTFRDADLLIQNFAARFHVSIPAQVDSVLRREDIVRGGDSIYLHSPTSGSAPVSSITEVATPTKTTDALNSGLFHTFAPKPFQQVQVQNIPTTPIKSIIQPQKLMRTVRGPQYTTAANQVVQVRPISGMINPAIPNIVTHTQLVQAHPIPQPHIQPHPQIGLQIKPLLPVEVNKPTTSRIDHYELTQAMRSSFTQRTNSRSLGTKVVEPLRSFRKNTVIGQGQTVPTVIKNHSSAMNIMSANPKLRTESRNDVLKSEPITLAESENVIVQPPQNGQTTRSQLLTGGKTHSISVSHANNPLGLTSSAILQHKIRSTSNIHQQNVVNQVAKKQSEVKVVPQSPVVSSMTSSMVGARAQISKPLTITTNVGQMTSSPTNVAAPVGITVPTPARVTNNVPITSIQKQSGTVTANQSTSTLAVGTTISPAITTHSAAQIVVSPPTSPPIAVASPPITVGSPTITINSERRQRTDGMTDSAFMNHISSTETRQQVTFKSTDVHPQVQITQQSSRIEQPEIVQPAVNMSFGNNLELPTFKYLQRRDDIKAVSHLPVTYGILKETEEFLSNFAKIKENYNEPISSGIRDSLGYTEDDLNLGKNLYYNKRQHTQELQQLSDYQPAYNRVVIEEYTTKIEVDKKQLDNLASGQMKYSMVENTIRPSGTGESLYELPMYSIAQASETYRKTTDSQAGYTVQMDSDLMEDLRKMRGQR